LDEGNFDVGKDFHNEELIPVNDIPYNEVSEEEATHEDENVDIEE